MAISMFTVPPTGSSAMHEVWAEVFPLFRNLSEEEKDKVKERAADRYRNVRKPNTYEGFKDLYRKILTDECKGITSGHVYWLLRDPALLNDDACTKLEAWANEHCVSPMTPAEVNSKDTSKYSASELIASGWPAAKDDYAGRIRVVDMCLRQSNSYWGGLEELCDSLIGAGKTQAVQQGAVDDDYIKNLCSQNFNDLYAAAQLQSQQNRGFGLG